MKWKCWRWYHGNQFDDHFWNNYDWGISISFNSHPLLLLIQIAFSDLLNAIPFITVTEPVDRVRWFNKKWLQSKGWWNYPKQQGRREKTHGQCGFDHVWDGGWGRIDKQTFEIEVHQNWKGLIGAADFAFV